MYLLEFLLRKSIRVGIPLFFWLAAVLIPILLAQLGVFDFALIDGRCSRPILRCGQDQIFQVGFGVFVLGAGLATCATAISACWYESEWVRERESIKAKYQTKPPSPEPTRPDIYSD